MILPYYHVLLISLFIVQVVHSTVENNEVHECDITSEFQKEISSYAPIVDRIIKATTSTDGQFKGRTYKELADFVDIFGSRFTGTQNLENAIDHMLNKSTLEGLDNVHGEDVQVPVWQRGEESATLLQPLHKNLAMLGLGYSIGTPSADGVTAQVLVVKSFDDLRQKSEQARGKIVVYNQEFTSYGETVQYRGKGASYASQYGAVATLIRSVTPYSMNTPHTGMQRYDKNVAAIPTACITVEDAHLLQRLQDRGENITIHLKMSARNLPQPRQSRNTVVELKGSSNPGKVVLVSGHLDSWDVGNGAMDDGGGAFISWASLVLLKSLNLRPKRTIRAVLWTGEEMGLIGAFAYQQRHLDETNANDIIFFMESDIGTFTPLGLEVNAGPKGVCILKEIVK